jgi:hypothetical protein
MTSSISSHLSRARALRARRGQRGAAFVESLIVISFILFMLFCVLWLQAVYTAKLQTIQIARANAWGDALQGCTGLEQADSALSDAVSQSNSTGANPPGDSTAGDVGGLRADVQGDDSPEWFNLREGGTSTESADGFTGIMDGSPMSITTTRKFLCNERSNPDELTLSAGDLFRNMASMVRDLFN